MRKKAQALTSNYKILVVDDDRTLADVIAFAFKREGYDVVLAEDGEAALQRWTQDNPDLIILDVNMPKMDGFTVCSRVREKSDIPIILLTVRGEEEDIVRGLNLGADDYITKPFSPRELVLRVRSVLRRSLQEYSPEPPVEVAGFELNPAARTVIHGGVALSLTAREFDLLAFLLRRPNQVFSREDLIKAVWGWDFGDLSTVTVHVRRLREKIENDPRHPALLKTVWGVGYRLDVPAAPGTETPENQNTGTNGAPPALSEATDARE